MALVQEVTGNEASTTTLTVTAGETLIVTLRERDGSAVNVSSDLNSTFSQIISVAAVIARTAVFRLKEPSAGTHTISVTGGSVRDYNVQRWSGLSTVLVDVSTSATNNSTSHTHGSITPTGTVTLITALGSGDHGGMTPQSGFTALSIDAGAQGNRQFYAYKTGHSGTINPTHASVNTVQSDAVVVAFLESAGGGGGGAPASSGARFRNLRVRA